MICDDMVSGEIKNDVIYQMKCGLINPKELVH